ncbi:unnamed protein product [Spirodela intermedia]|uniref:Uncharacterized protein n=1 Tax=Spirodela intermedia TaxID=51605 RepID=A0A7I8J531_SPIIN|nr:unnamed protein product [Spirodela intermedia]CAA6665150.1 unnamed protein product [Spirodela intermedia]
MSSRRSRTRQVPPSQVLQETCKHIRGLQRQVDDLSQRLSELLTAEEMTDAQVEIIGVCSRCREDGCSTTLSFFFSHLYPILFRSIGRRLL